MEKLNNPSLNLKRARMVTLITKKEGGEKGPEFSFWDLYFLLLSPLDLGRGGGKGP